MKVIQQSNLTQIQGGFVGIPTVGAAMLSAPVVFGFIAIGSATGLAIYGIYQGIKGAINKNNDSANDTVPQSSIQYNNKVP
ncbi:MAG: hypothetical protein ISP86_03140 [Shewanellaceae bacterium]|nr:hypothetical protein [Shewanellaceae bacterium]